MTVTMTAGGQLREVPLRRLPTLLRDPFAVLDKVAVHSDGAIVRLHLGLFRPLLVTHPDHIEHVLRGSPDVYRREGMMWEPLRRLVGNGIAAEGETWRVSRELLQPIFSGRYIGQITEQMAQAITVAIDDLWRRVGESRPVDSYVEMTRIVHRVICQVFFGERITRVDAKRLAPAIEKAATSFAARLLMPFAPPWVPLPGDREFARVNQVVDDVILPIVRRARRDDRRMDSVDIVSVLLRAHGPGGVPLSDRQIRDEIVAMFLAGSESTAVALTWLWVVLQSHPQVAERLYDEVDSVVGSAAPNRTHVRQLRYTKMVIQELLRIYSPGWMFPRTAAVADTIDGVAVRAGSTIVISPYVTHRLESVWPRPGVFDPERFTPDADRARHRLAFMAFGAGPHQCLGSAFFTVEAQLIIAAMLSRFRPTLTSSDPIRPRPALTLRPRTPVLIVLRAR